MNNNPIMNNNAATKTVQVNLNKVFKAFYSNYLLDMDNLNTTGEFLISLLINPKTEEILVVKNRQDENLFEKVTEMQLVFVGSIDVNKVLTNEDVLIAVNDFIHLPKYQKTLKDEALDFIAEAAKELFVSQFEETDSGAEHFERIEVKDKVEESKFHNLSTPKEVLKEINALLDGIVSDEPALTKEVLQQSKLFDFVVHEIINFEVGEGLDKVTLFNALVKKDIISSEQFILLTSKFIDLERNSIFSDPEAIELFLNQLSQSYVAKNNFSYIKEETLKEFFNKVSKIILEQKNPKFIVHLGQILSKTNII
jgi:hypothetical protein